MIVPDTSLSRVSKQRDDQRAAAISVLKSELQKDVQWMLGVARKPNSDPVWDDITGQNRNTVVNSVRDQILGGEKEMARQDLDKLKDP